MTKGTVLLYFAFDYCHEKVLSTVFTRNISGIVTGQVFLWFLSLEILSQIPRSSLSPSGTFQYLSQEYYNYSFINLDTARRNRMKNESGLILIICPVVQIQIHKPNAKIKNVLDIKLPWKVRVDKSYTVVILLVSNLSFLQI